MSDAEVGAAAGDLVYTYYVHELAPKHKHQDFTQQGVERPTAHVSFVINHVEGFRQIHEDRVEGIRTQLRPESAIYLYEILADCVQMRGGWHAQAGFVTLSSTSSDPFAAAAATGCPVSVMASG
ncbi:unnamed protein product [Schistocephalus solidus]|uniref:Uncharacterized protein n=1 Tax=Schistocephalus solidus TaxID=70667 RepID=A0A3P7CGV1_SCHSO|nr:unnamed protein product [Schistocephalus solidus]